PHPRRAARLRAAAAGPGRRVRRDRRLGPRRAGALRPATAGAADRPRLARGRAAGAPPPRTPLPGLPARRRRAHRWLRPRAAGRRARPPPGAGRCRASHATRSAARGPRCPARARGREVIGGRDPRRAGAPASAAPARARARPRRTALAREEGRMHTLVAIVIGALVIFIGYAFYARRIDREVIQSDPKRATPARMYLDGVDFVPTSRNVLYGYHFKSIAAAGPIVGAITAAGLWGWLPSLIWLGLGVIFMGWVSDYSALVVSVRNEGDSLSATAHKLIHPRTRRILLLFIFFYLLLVAGAFGNIVAGVLNSPIVPLGIIALAVLGALGGQMLYRMKLDLLLVTAITVIGTLVAVLLNADANGAVATFFKNFNAALNAAAPNGIVTVLDPTRACVPPQGQTACTAAQLAAAQSVPVTVSFIFWLFALFVFCYLGSVLPIWRFAQPVNYIGFWITALTIVLGGLGAVLAVVVKPELASFKLPAYVGFMGPPAVVQSGALQP